jgi:hypothetical protein
LTHARQVTEIVGERLFQQLAMNGAETTARDLAEVEPRLSVNINDSTAERWSRARAYSSLFQSARAVRARPEPLMLITAILRAFIALTFAALA